MRPFARFDRLAAVAALAAAATLLTACAAGVSLDEPIESRVWRLTSLGLQPVRTAPTGADPQRDPQVQFDGTRVSGSGGCNRLTGEYRRTGYDLKIGPLAATRMACVDPERSTVETAFVGALQATTGYALVGSQLTLLDAGGRTLAVLESR
ncbi:MAG: META domain-containing protein [Janthinobacterium lividum]